MITPPASCCAGASERVDDSLEEQFLCAELGVILLIMAVRRGHVVPPFWKQKG